MKAVRHYNPGMLAKSLWMAMAMFFLVVCSCPVKKYIRLQLYKHHPITEKSAYPDHIKIKDVKDCTIAEKLEQSSMVLAAPFFLFAGDDLVPLLSVALLSFAALIFFRRYERTVLFKPHEPAPRAVPLYLRVRHLQI